MIGTFLFLAFPVAAQSTTGPCSRRTSIVLSEIQYHPRSADQPNGEFIELYNSSPISVDLSGWQLRGDADFDFPKGTRIAGKGFLLVAADPTRFPNDLTVLGPWTGDLSDGGGRVRLRKASGGIVLETNYKDNTRWPAAADGAGHSLVLKYPSYGESRREAWSASYHFGGSPGEFDPSASSVIDQVIISEVLAHPAAGEADFVELHNPSTQAMDLSGCYLSQDRDLSGYQLPDGSMITPGGFLAISGDIAGFDFEATGDRIFLRAPDGLRVIASRRFSGQARGRSWGGHSRWRELGSPSPGAPNAPVYRDPVVINEIHYHPVGLSEEGEFIELFNQSPNPVDLTGWKLKGGIDFNFPAGTVIGSGGYIVIARNLEFLLDLHPKLLPDGVPGNFSGSLSNRSERIELEDAGNRTVDEVTYFDGGRWPSKADGGGSTLQLRDPRADNDAPSNWHAPDESADAQSIVVEHTGILDLGHRATPQASRFFVMLHGEGEAIIDEVEVLVNGRNLVQNAGFDSGLTGWSLFGTHGGTFAANGAMHLVATSEGDLANLVETSLSTPIPPGTEVTLRASCRWVSGDPDILLGLNGGFLEAPGKLPVPVAVGTPGRENSGAGNTGPAITEVSHSPLLPQAGEPVLIRARITDPDEVLSARLRYRLDPNSSLSQVIMTEAEDGFFTATIPGQSPGTLLAFHLVTIDNASPRVIARFPENAPTRECLVRVGSRNEVGDLSTMHLWAAEETLTEWRNRPRSSNQELDVTFVAEGRAFYNTGAYYSGSQNGVTIYDSPVGNPTGYNLKIPDDEVFLNVRDLTIDRETTRDPTRQRERLLFWFLEKLKLPNLHRRYVHFYINGFERDQLIMESVQKPNREIMEQWFEGEGRLTKTAPWWEFDANSSVILSAGTERNLLRHLVSANGSIKLPHHRWTWTHGAGHDDGNDFSGIISLIDAAQAPINQLVRSMNEKAEMRQWMRTFAMNDLGSFWDTFGNQANKNAYLFESFESGKWSIVIWDMDVGLGVFNDPVNYPLFHPNVDPNVQRLFNQPGLVRNYWQALDESLNSFFTAAAGSEARSILQETYDALLANDAAVTSPFVPSGRSGLSVDDWISQRRTFIQNELAGKDSAFGVSGPASSSTRKVTITGRLPLATTTLTANGLILSPEFSTITRFTAEVALQPGLNEILIEASDQNGERLGWEILTINYTGNSPWPELKINEWMAANPRSSGILDPADQDADDWIELHNPTGVPVSLDGWSLSDDPSDPLKFPIPAGFTLPPNGFLLVWADDEANQNAPTLRPEIHANFRLSADGEFIILTAPDGSEVDSVAFSPQSPGMARLRSTDASPDFTYSLESTPGTTNGIPPVRDAVEVSLDRSAITFPSTEGEIYELQVSPDLTQWQSTEPPVIGNNMTLSFAIPSDPNFRFFRIITH